MGRYYDGDIEGKFIFAHQSSTVADRFGVEGTTPNYLDYYFDESNLEDLETELKNIEESFEEYATPILAYYELFGSGDDNEISFAEYLKKGGLQTMSSTQWSEFHDYRIGRKILECIKAIGDCSFTVEL